MLNPEQIRSMNAERATAIFDRFTDADKEAATGNLSKSEDSEGKEEIYFLEEDIDKFSEDLFKAIDEGTLSEEQIEKAKSDLESLEKKTMLVKGVETEVFVKGK